MTPAIEWEFALFMIIASWCLLCALLTISVKKIMHAIVWLINLMIGIAALYVFLTAEFLGMVQLIVYAGGIMVLMLFGIMLTGKDPIYLPSEYISWKYSLPPAVFLLVIGLYAIFDTSDAFLPDDITNAPSPQEGLRQLAIVLFNDYWIVMLILSAILLAALIGSVYIVKREVWESKESGLA